MNTAHLNYPTAHTLRQRWLATYNDFLGKLIALRVLVKRSANKGLLREQIRNQAIQLTDLADQLLALGFRVNERFAAAESNLWIHTLNLAAELPWETPPCDVPHEVLESDLNRIADSWNRFQSFVVNDLPEDFFDHLPALDPQTYSTNGLKRLTGERRSPVPVNSAPVAAAHSTGVQPDHIR